MKKHAVGNQKAGIVGVLLIVVLWAAAAAAVGREVLIPGPLRVLQELLGILSHPATPRLIAGSALRWLTAFSYAAVLGAASGSMAYRYSWFADGIRPLIIAVRAIPVIAIILIALVWLPLSQVGILVGLLVAYPLIHQGILDGLRSIDPQLLEVGRIFRLPVARAVRFIYLPGSLPVLLSTLMAAVGMSWKAVIAAEVLSQPAQAIGTALQTAKLYIDTPRVFAWTIIAIMCAALVDGVLLLFDRRLYRHNTRISSTTRPSGSPNPINTSRRSDAADTAVSIQINHLNFSYPETSVFADLSLTIHPGEITVLFGPSGCGKTTLLRLCAGILAPVEDSVIRSDRKSPKPCTSFVFQEPRLLPWTTIYHNLELAGSRLQRQQRSQNIHEILHQIHIPLPQAYPDQLSGGMQQRINLARGFLYHAGLICLDEPFANQDGATRAELLQLALNLHRRHRPTMIWVTHDPQEAITVADRIVLLSTPDSSGSRILADYRISDTPAAQRNLVLQTIANYS